MDTAYLKGMTLLKILKIIGIFVPHLLCGIEEFIGGFYRITTMGNMQRTGIAMYFRVIVFKMVGFSLDFFFSN
jgi:hypothetical protein